MAIEPAVAIEAAVALLPAVAIEATCGVVDHRRSVTRLAPLGSRAMTSRMLLEYDGRGFAGWARQPEQRTVQDEVERALATVLVEERRPRHRRRPHRPRRARLGAGLLLRARGGRPAAAQRRAARRRRGPRVQPGPRRVRRARRRPARGPTATASSTAEPARHASRARSTGTPGASTATRSTPAPPACRGPTTSPRSPRPRPTTCASSATSCARGLGARRRPAGALDHRRHVHAPHEPDPRRDDARGRGRAPLRRGLRGAAARRAALRRRRDRAGARPRARVGGLRRGASPVR